jgi:hypothetical protein
VNHHPEITIAEYGNLQEILSKPDEVIIDKRIDDRTKKKRDNLLFTKKYGTNLMAVISLEEEEDGRILLHKSLYGHKKSPYPGLPRVQGISSGGGPSPIGRTAEAIPGGNLPARDDTLNIDDFVRPVNPSEVSQVRDANGEPAPVFHGTRAKFEAFSLEKAGTRRDSGMLGKGFYFSTDKYAASAGDPITLTLFANTKNPLYLKMEKWSQNKSETVSKALGFDGIKDSAEIRDKIIQSGYDGVVLDYSPLGYEQKEIMMLNPEQVKSATDNTGTFDITNPSILFQTAYHGTPHQVDRFDTARIGTGEGSQAYGWGLYFAGSKEVAEYYRKTLSGRNIGFRAGKLEFRHDTKGGWINTQTGEEYGGTIIEQIISETYSFIKNPDHKNIINGKPYMEWIERTVPFLNDPIALQIFEAVKTNDTELIKDAGHLYEVDIPDDNELLDWDKPLSEQPVQVRSSIETLIKENPVLDYVFSDRQSISGMQFYRGIVEQFGTDRAVSNALNGVGIKGIRYLDNASRASGHGFCNYVIFDDSVISEPTLLFQAGDRDMMEEAADFEDGKDFRAYIETFFELPKEVDGFTDEQIDAWFDEFVKKAKEAVRSGEQGSETSAPAGGKPAPAEVDREFNELIGEPGKLDEFVDSLTKAHNEDYDDWQALDAEDEAERGRQMETTDILRRKLTHPTWQSIFKANGEMGPVQRKQLLTLIRKAPREYRAIYAEVMNRPEYAVSAEDTTAEALKYRITDSRRESVDNLTPEKLRQLAEQLDIDTFAEKVKTGRALFNDPAEKAYIKQLQGQIKEVEQTLKEVEADRNEDNEYIERMAGKQFLDTFNRAVEAREEIRRSKDKLDKAVAAQKKDARSLVWKAQRVTANYNSIVQTLESLARARKLELDIRDILENQRIHDAVQAAKKELKTEAREKIDALKDEVKKVRAREREKASVQRKFAAIMAARDMKAHLEDLQERRENRKIYTDAKRKVVKRITRQINTREVNAEQGMAAAIIQRLAEPSMLEGLDRFIGGIEKPYLRTIFETWKVDETLRTGILKDKAKAAQDKMTRIFEKKSFDHLTNEEKKYLYRVIPPNDWAEALGLEDIIRIRNENYPTMNGEAERQIALKYLPPDVYYRIMDKPFSEWTLEEAEELAKIIDNLIVRGKEIRKADIDAEKQRIKAYQKAVVETIGTVAKRGLADSPDDTPEERARKKAGREKILNEFDEGTKGTAQAQARRRNFKGPVLGYADMNMFHFARMLDNGETGGKNGAALYRRPGDAYNMKMAAIDSRTERIEKVMTEQKITKTELWGKTVEIDLGGDLGKAAFTAAELIGFLSAIRDDYSREAVMYGNLLSERERGPYQQDGITEAELAPLYDLAEGRFFQVKKAAEKLIAETSGYRKLLEAIDADFTEGGKRLSQALIRYNNTYMPIVDKYFPINRQAPVTVQGADASLARDLMGASTGGFNLFVEKGFTNKRQAIPAQYQTAIKLDILGVWTDAVSREEHFMAYGQLVKDLNAIYKGNRQVKDAIERRYGRQAVDYINKYVNELANPAPDRVRSTFDKAIRAMRGNAPAAFLGWKVSSIVKQFITSPAPFLGYMNPLEYWGTFVEYATRQEESWKEITDLSEHMKHRSANLLTDLVKEQAKRTFENKMDAAISKMSERGIQGLEWIDRMCVAPGWMVLYRTELKRLTGGNTDGTLTERDAKVKAAQYADDIIRATQPSARPEDIAPLFKGNSELGKAYLQFTQSLNIIWQNIRYDVPQMIRDRRYKNAAGLIMGYILSGIMLGAITEGFDDDDDETARALRFAKWAAQQFTDSFPIIGSEATHFAELAITGKARHQSGLNLVPAFQKIRNAAESGVKGAREQDFDRFLKAAATAAEGAAIFKGLPVSGIKEAGLILGISGDEEPGIHPEAVLGRR